MAGLLWVNETLLEEGRRAGAQQLRGAQVREYARLGQGHRAGRVRREGHVADQDYFMAMANAVTRTRCTPRLTGGELGGPGPPPAFEDWKTIFDDKVVQDGAVGAATYTDTYDLFADGKAASSRNGSWNLDMYTNSLDKIKDYELSVIPFPCPGADAQVHGHRDSNGIMVINKASKNKAAAYKSSSTPAHGEGLQELVDASLDQRTPPARSSPPSSWTNAADIRAESRCCATRRSRVRVAFRAPPSPTRSGSTDRGGLVSACS
jgi:raffinose/stachyose/melibiose transport system substrate-binding protein